MEDTDILRAVYIAALRDGVAKTDSVSPIAGGDMETVWGRLEEAEREGLVEAKDGTIALTPKGRRELEVVMIGGAFEIIHPGHIHTISEARRYGDILVVVVATDKTVQKNKGREPVTPQEWRVKLISALRDVDLALPGGQGSIYDTLEKVRPDIVAIGYDQKHVPQEIESEAAKRGMHVKVVRLTSPIPSVKTSKIVSALGV